MAEETQKIPSSQTMNAERTRDRKTYIPRVDIYESGDNIYLVADMPGADESSVNISLDRDLLTIEAHVNDETPKEAKTTYSEYGIGDYYRTFTLSDEIDRDKIEANIKNGVLKVALPKAEPHKTKKIAIQAG